MQSDRDNVSGSSSDDAVKDVRTTAIGLMSGTSMDGIDVALIETDGVSVYRLGAFGSYPYVDELRAALKPVVGKMPLPSSDLDQLVRDITDAHAEAVQDFVGRSGIDLSSVDVAGFHGQTVFHDPENAVTCQLGDGQRLAAALGVPVVNDFRSADVAAGGEGAPFAPLYHAALARQLEAPVCVLNLGGVGNLSWISADGAVIAFDTGPASAMIDDWVHEHTGEIMDTDGALARTGKVDSEVLVRLLDDPYFSKPFPKSLDRDHFDRSCVNGLSLEDGAATLVAFTAMSVKKSAELLPAPPLKWLVTGGGRHNPAIMAGLRRLLDSPVEPVETVGWNGDAIEAQAFAFLAVRSIKGLPLSMPSTTGVPKPQRGGVFHLPHKT
jgi:anhydro-N-acetylmuramic acid kinase